MTAAAQRHARTIWEDRTAARESELRKARQTLNWILASDDELAALLRNRVSRHLKAQARDLLRPLDSILTANARRARKDAHR